MRTKESKVKTREELTKHIECSCLTLPCVHNPEISQDILGSIVLPIEIIKKGRETDNMTLQYVYLPKANFKVIEETADMMKLQIINK